MKPGTAVEAATRTLHKPDVGNPVGPRAHHEARIDDLQKRAGGLITPLGVAPLPAGVELVRTGPHQTYDWVFCLLENDPTYQQGQLVIPGDVRRRLRELDGRGVYFDALVIGHEVDKGQARAALDQYSRMKLLVGTTHTLSPPKSVLWTNAAIRGLAAAARAVGTATVGIAAAAAAAGFLVADPVLLGAITVDGTATANTPSALFHLASWS